MVMLKPSESKYIWPIGENKELPANHVANLIGKSRQTAQYWALAVHFKYDDRISKVEKTE